MTLRTYVESPPASPRNTGQSPGAASPEYPRALAAVDQDIVRPAQVGREAGGLGDRFPRRKPESQHHQWNGSREAEHNRDVQPCALRRVPRVAVPPHASSLLIGADHRSMRAPLAGKLRRDGHGGVDALKPLKAPHGFSQAAP